MFSLILPAHNEADTLETCVTEAQKILSAYRYEIIIAEDGSSDGTYEIAKKLARQNKKIKVLHDRKKLGRGLALKRAFEIANGERVGYLDVDMATDMKYLKTLINLSGKYDVVTASRYLEGSKTRRPLLRLFVSRTYNFLINMLLGCKITDYQCGFKAFSKRFLEAEVRNINEKSWAWDTIVLLVASKKGYKLREFPVEWHEKKDYEHSASLKRLFKDINIHGKVLLKVFMLYRLGINVRL